MGSDAPASVYSMGEALLSKGDMVAAFQHYGPLLLASPADARLHEGAARAIAAGVATDRVAEMRGAGQTFDEVAGLLIRKVSVDRDPPLLHELVANYYTNNSKKYLERAGEAFDACLEQLCGAGPPDKPVTLMLLLLREHLGGWISQDEITAHHLRWIRDFTPAELTLPYSTMVEGSSFTRNRLDVRTVVGTTGSAADLTGWSLIHILVFEWLLSQDITTSPSQLLEQVVRELDGLDDAPTLAAAKSLIVRHTGPDAPLPVSMAARLGGEQLQRLRQSIETRRNVLGPSSPDGSAAAGSEARLADRRWQAAFAARNMVLAKAPVGVRRRGPRVAVCVSGQLRGFRTTLQTWRRSLLADVDADVFVHTWRQVGRSSAEPFREALPFEGERFTAAYREACLLLGFDEVRARYPSLFTDLAGTATIDERTLGDLYGTEYVSVEDETVPPQRDWSNQDKMHRKIGACYDLATAEGREYDLVIRVRPDLPVRMMGFAWRDLLAACRSRSVLYADHASGAHYTHLVIGDQFAVGTQETMALYSHTWSSYPEIASNGLFDCSESLTGHSSLAQVCWVHRIEVRRAPIRFGALQEAEPMASAQILRAIDFDATGRMDDVDRALLDALTADQQAT